MCDQEEFERLAAENAKLKGLLTEAVGELRRITTLAVIRGDPASANSASALLGKLGAAGSRPSNTEDH